MLLPSEDPVRAELAGAERPTTLALVLWESGSATYFLRLGERLNIGRHRDCEIVIALPNVSRHHACLIGADPASGTLATIEDTGGMDGVRVGGLRISAHQPVPVEAGDVIELAGALVIVYPASKGAAPSAGAIVRAAARHPTGADPAKAVERQLDVVAGSDLRVLVVGEKGVGKTLAAEMIHARSARANALLLRLDCSALPEALLEGALFGHESGASAPLASVATAPATAVVKAGVLEGAAAGTVLLDEVGEMSLATQARLLHVLATHEIVCSGGEERPLTARILATTSHDLTARAAQGTFLPELLRQLNGISVMIPPLRERGAEIPRLARRFIAEASMRAGHVAPRLSNTAVGALVHHPFPGNVRELRDTMERACALARGGIVEREHLQFDANVPARPPRPALAATRRFRPMPATEPPGPSSEKAPLRKP